MGARRSVSCGGCYLILDMPRWCVKVCSLRNSRCETMPDLGYAARTSGRSLAVPIASVEKFVLSYVAGSPLAGPVSQANDAVRGALIADVRKTLARYTSNSELA